MKNYENIQWVVQRNLTGEEVFAQLKEACRNIGVGYVEVQVIPFTSELPYFDRDRKSIFYGSTTFGQLVNADPEIREGFFFSPQTFSMENYFEKWGERMLNFGAQLTTFPKILKQPFEKDQLLFIRPNDDSKSFAGEMKRFDEIENWYKKLETENNNFLNGETLILISEPYQIQSEWRLWMVEGRVVAASKYRENFRLRKEKGCPEEVRQFAEERCREYMPHDVFVMDIGLCGDDFYIVECGCMNSAGFYAADISVIVSEVTSYFERKIIG